MKSGSIAGHSAAAGTSPGHGHLAGRIRAGWRGQRWVCATIPGTGLEDTSLLTTSCWPLSGLRAEGYQVPTDASLPMPSLLWTPPESQAPLRALGSWSGTGISTEGPGRSSSGLNKPPQGTRPTESGGAEEEGVGAPGELRPSAPNPSRADAPASWGSQEMATSAVLSTPAGQATVAAMTW